MCWTGWARSSWGFQVPLSPSLGFLRTHHGATVQGPALLQWQAISAKRKEAAQKERDAQLAQNEQRSGRPRGRTMLAPPKAVLEKAGPSAAVLAAHIPRSLSLQNCVGTAETIGRRATMEDAVLVQGQLGGVAHRDLYAVFDGHGSERVAVHCAKRFGEVLLKQLDSGAEPLVALRSTFLSLSEEVKVRSVVCVFVFFCCCCCFSTSRGGA